MRTIIAFLLFFSPALADEITPDSFANRITKDALKLTITNVSIRQRQFYMQGAPMGDPVPESARISFTIENNSGIPLGMALRARGRAVPRCTARLRLGIDG